MADVKICAQCKANFPINPEDVEFYKKINVPAPSFCPDCRMIRRLMFRNERTWYKRTCDATGKNILSMFAPDKKYTVYDQQYWKSDAWDPLEYGIALDLNRPFFAQFRELFEKVPHTNLIQKNNVNSDYTNCTLNLKNCYYCASTDSGEDSAYVFAVILRVKNSLDLHQATDTEGSYELVDCNKSSNLRFSQSCEGCINSWLLYDCRNCNDCIGCVGLRGKSYCIFNQPYSKEEYGKKLQELNLSSYAGLQAAKKRFEELKLKVPRKFASILKSEDAIGEDIINSNDVRGFSIKNGSEHVRYSYRVVSSSDIWDSFTAWNGAEVEYETLSCSGQRINFSCYIWGGFDVQYSYNCYDCNNIFGCVGLRNKSYCILNTQYSKEEYEKLLPSIIEQMKKSKEYGEFFPAAISPFSYNETICQDYFPTTKEAALVMGFSWREPEKRMYQITMKKEDIPDTVKDVTDAILAEIIECEHNGSDCHEQCAGAFKLIPLELQYYRQWGVPLPRLCPSCRHFSRVKQKPPLKLYKGSCKKCSAAFTTPYSPDSPYTLYCESCYQQEVV